MVSLKQPTYESQPPRAKVILLLVVPAVLGIVTGLALGFTGIGYYICQIIALLGGISAGTECRGAVTAVVRGVIAGAVFGLFIIAMRAVLDRPDHAHLAGGPAAVPIGTAIAGVILGLIGWAIAGRKRVD